jgi:hypothetical protein
MEIEKMKMFPGPTPWELRNSVPQRISLKRLKPLRQQRVVRADKQGRKLLLCKQKHKKSEQQRLGGG